VDHYFAPSGGVLPCYMELPRARDQSNNEVDIWRYHCWDKYRLQFEYWEQFESYCIGPEVVGVKHQKAGFRGGATSLAKQIVDELSLKFLE